MSNQEPNFTMGDLLHQLAEEYGYIVHEQSEDGVYTTTEICKLLRLSRHAVISMLREKYEKGEIEVTSKKVDTLGGFRKQTVPAYKSTKGEIDGED